MSTRARILSLLLLTPAVLASNCGKDDTSGDTGAEACAPAANAGEDLDATYGSTVTLNGCPPDYSQPCDDVEYNYVWTIESMPVDSELDESLLSDNNSATACQTSFTPDATGTYVLSMYMTDTEEETTPDLVIVDVTSGNQPPVADCGGDATVEVGERVELDGSGSYDPEGAAIEYSWALSSWPEGSSLDNESIYNSGGASPTIIPDTSGMFLVSLVVSDGEQWSDPDYCTVTASSENQAPVADAGIGSTLPPCSDNIVELNGYASYDPEGAAIEYLWDILEVPAGSHADGSLDSGDTGPVGSPAFDDTTLATPTFTWDVIGTYTFQLSVFDGELWSAPDVVSFTVPDPSTNNAPTANAGDDQTITAETECDLVSYGVHECDPCEGETVELDGTSSEDTDGDEINYYWSDATGELTIHTPYASFTQVTSPQVETEVGGSSATTWTVNLDVSDCMYSDTDSASIAYTCEAGY